MMSLLFQLSGAFGKLYSPSKQGLSNDTVEPSRADGAVHENCIKYFICPIFIIVILLNKIWTFFPPKKDLLLCFRS